MVSTANQIFRNWVLDGVPSSGAHEPEKAEIREWGAYLESFIASIGASGSSVYLTRAELFADLTQPAKASAWVIQDPTVAYNGVYRKNGGVGTGSWTRVGDLPYSFIVATDSGVGTPDAIQAVTSIPISPSALVILNIFDTNSGSPVTVSFNGGTPLTIKTNSGNDITPGGLPAGMFVLGVASGTVFRLVNDQVSSAIVTAAEAAQTAAETAAGDAAADAADIHALLVGVSMLGDGSAFPQGRLTLTSGVATPAADVAGATTVYYISAGTGRYVPHWTGVAVLPLNIVAGLSMALSSNAAHAGYHQSGRNFDLYVFDDAGTVRLGTGPSWNAGAVAGSDTARGTGAGSTELEVFQGILVNKNAITLRWGSASGDTVAVPARLATYVGSMRTVADGQVSDTAEMRFLFNAYNQVERQLRRNDPAASWVYTATSFRQANGNAANKLQVLLGLSGIKVKASIQHTAFNTAGSTARPCVVMFQVGGVDFPLGSTGGVFNTPALLSGIANGVAMYEGYPGLGLQELIWREGGNTDVTFQSFAAGFARSGMLGSFLG
ncbi:hypothetical protein [Rhizobium leguminosarum]|uniref:hypothetical protein n=1 Tax=Rhizobium leguminosarum TaxID=384 RepID=UPI00144210B1|nr:hypothetical protein [Rhizobium leguminosarum]MBY5863270.1 hypothetical protein [Rhizobium leguminosarum]NKM04150.1 hypothetical protein [Rhizobium leguminosarum bv. viciae]